MVPFNEPGNEPGGMTFCYPLSRFLTRLQGPGPGEWDPLSIAVARIGNLSAANSRQLQGEIAATAYKPAKN